MVMFWVLWVNTDPPNPSIAWSSASTDAYHPDFLQKPTVGSSRCFEKKSFQGGPSFT